MAQKSARDQISITPSKKIIISNKSIFIWLDILGFSESLESEDKYNDLAECLEYFQSLFNKDDVYTTTVISDGILLNFDDKLNASKFKNAITLIGKKQLEFICEKKEFIRGGIAVGTMHKDIDKKDNPIFIGNGLARAVKVEEKQVTWPIIGTNNANMEEIIKFFNINNEKENFGLCRSFNETGERIYFIDFLDENKSYYELLKKKIKDSKDSLRVRKKYIWLLRYYHHKYGVGELNEELEGIIL